MATLQTQRDFRRVRDLSFCYLCGREIGAKEKFNRDHVPPKAAFNARDREPALKLRTHEACHSQLSDTDKKVGQLIALRRGEGPRSERDQALHFIQQGNMVGVQQPNVEEAVWRWVMGFHAALYRQPVDRLTPRSIQTPFPHGQIGLQRIKIDPIREQHLVAVDVIKRNRITVNLDSLKANRGNLRYECVWRKADNEEAWACFFALDIYDWKDLGSHSAEVPARGCVGMYMLRGRSTPPGAACDQGSVIVVPNYDIYDAFGR